MTDYTSEDVYMKMREQVGPGRDGFWPQRLELMIEQGDTAWNPTSTSSTIAGPALITYTEHGDGAWECGWAHPELDPAQRPTAP